MKNKKSEEGFHTLQSHEIINNILTCYDNILIMKLTLVGGHLYKGVNINNINSYTT
jgi:hypothetical protein